MKTNSWFNGMANKELTLNPRKQISEILLIDGIKDLRGVCNDSALSQKPVNLVLEGMLKLLDVRAGAQGL
jgi:hypothetical protein